MMKSRKYCDVCYGEAILTLRVQGEIMDLCSRECAHVYLDRDLEQQQKKNLIYIPVRKEAVV